MEGRAVSRSPGAGAPASILVIKLGALGDVVQALGPMAAIRRHHAGARITVLTTAPFAPLLSASPYVDETWIDPRPRAWQLGTWLALRRKLRGGRFARVYDLQTSGRSSSYFRLFAPGPRPEWSGIAPGGSHPHANSRRDFMHTIERQAEQLCCAGIAEVPPTDVSWLAADLGRYALPPRFALLVPGGSAARLRKRWPAAAYGALAQRLLARGLTPVVIGIASERPLAAIIRAACPETRDLTGQTSFAEIAALARAAQVTVGNDTGPLHLIAAAGCRCVVLFSAESDPALCAPRGNVEVLRRDKLADLPLGDVLAAVFGFKRRPDVGERYRVNIAFEANVLTHWHVPFTGGHKRLLPVGLEFVIDVPPPPSAMGAGAKPDPYDSWERQLVDDTDRTADKYGGYSLVVPFELLESNCSRL